MKRFVKKLLILLLIMAALALLVNAAYEAKRVPDYDNTDKFSSVPERIRVCNFGSSHGLCGFNYEDCEEDWGCFNFGLLSQYLSYDFRLFRNYASRIEEGATVFLPVSYFSLLGEDETNLGDFESKNRRYYAILPPALIKEYDPGTALCERFIPVLAVDKGTLLRTLQGRNVPDLTPETWRRTADTMDIAADAQAAYMRHVGYQCGYEEYVVNRGEIDALYDLIHGCREIGAVPVLITMPYLREYTDAVKGADGFFELFYSIIGRVASDTGTDFCDYAFDERFADRYDWFMNADHLNEEGARVFTDIVLEEVAGLPIQGN